MNFVSQELRDAPVPCHQIPVNDAGETIDDLELKDNQTKMENAVKNWLCAQIERIEKERSKVV